MTRPIVIAHRGASGYIPEHTLAAYSLAILQGADYVEPDLVMTKDGHLIARHDNVLNLTTDVAQRSVYNDRRQTKMIDGQSVDGWFSEDFSLEEIKGLRAIERIPEIRPTNQRFDRMFEIPTFSEIIDLVKGMEKTAGRQIGIIPEIKHSSYFSAIDLSMEESLIDQLFSAGYQSRQSPICIQSFEITNLQKLSTLCDFELLQLLSHSGQPYDQTIAGTPLSYDDMSTKEGLIDIASYAHSVGPEKRYFIADKNNGDMSTAEYSTNFVINAQSAGLQVYPYTFRAENEFLGTQHRSSDKANEEGDLLAEILFYLDLGIDGFFTDYPDIGRKAKEIHLVNTYR